MPNGLAFSPDESIFYVDDSQDGHVYAFDVTSEGLIENKESFARVEEGATGKGAADGIKVDVDGNVFVSAPEGVVVFSPEGIRLGILVCPEIPSNLAWGDHGYQTLYITARTGIYRIKTKTGGTSLVPDFVPKAIY